MRLISWLAACLAAPLAAAYTIDNAMLANSALQNAHLHKRANPTTGCTCYGYTYQYDNGPQWKMLFNYGLAVPGVSTTNPVGWCFNNGVMDTAGVNRIATALQGTVNTPYVNISWAKTYCTRSCVGCTAAQCATSIANGFSTLMFATTTNYLSPCTWPANNYVMKDCKCGFTCNTGYTACGINCINTATQSCVSGVPVTKKARRGLPHVCPEGYRQCQVPGGGFECLDTRSDIESCGGCPSFGSDTINPGTDCTELPNVSAVQCIDGACRVNGCNRGHTLLGGHCIPNIAMQAAAGSGGVVVPENSTCSSCAPL